MKTALTVKTWYHYVFLSNMKVCIYVSAICLLNVTLTIDILMMQCVMAIEIHSVMQSVI